MPWMVAALSAMGATTAAMDANRCRNPSNRVRTSYFLSGVVSATHAVYETGKERGIAMFLILAIVLVVMWLGGFVMFHTAGFLIHLLLLFAVISLVLHFVTGRSAA